jgi:hypothetical protein
MSFSNKKLIKKDFDSRAGALKRTYQVDELGLSTVSVARPYVSQPHLFVVIHTGDRDFALADVVVRVDVVHQSTVGCMHREDSKSFKIESFFFGKNGKIVTLSNSSTTSYSLSKFPTVPCNA